MAQAKNLRDELQSIRKKEAGFFKQNGKHDLTADQQSQPNQMLDDNGKSLPDVPIFPCFLPQEIALLNKKRATPRGRPFFYPLVRSAPYRKPIKNSNLLNK